jgi:hypothetical protein
MLAASHSFLGKLGMVVGTGADDHELDFCVGEEVVGGAVMLCIGIVDGAVLARFDAGLISGSFCALQERVHFEVSVRGDERQMETLGGKAIAHKSDFDWCHCESSMNGVS